MLEFDAMEKGKTLVVGHRGADGYAPENTMLSFEKGLQCGADLLELDIHVSLDGELMIMHDSEVDRTTDGTGPIENMTLAQINKLDAGVKFNPKFKGVRVPTLRELLDWSKDKIPLVIEIKGNPFPAPGIEEKLIKMLREYNLIPETMVISFHHECMKRFKKTEPALATGLLLMGELVDPLQTLKSCNADSWRPGWQYWTKEKVEAVQKSGVTASTWNADIESVMDRIVPMGLASIGSNFPDRLRSYIDKCGRGYK
ncbi:MAG: glycerophosphodiester phosphodiesterase family protein [Spirochaetes bacterium]|nr:glycerophosphodiester phosphodiesterase family protein [Spirochaetota bacterium]